MILIALRARAGLALLLVVVTNGLLGQAGTPARDSTRRPLVSRVEMLGGIGILSAALLADGALRGEVQKIRTPSTNRLAAIGNGFGNGKFVLPPLAALYLVGRFSHNQTLMSTMLETGAAFMVAGAAVAVLKEVVGRARPLPGGDPRRYRPFSGFDSFPSGHVTVAFAVAASLAKHANSWAQSLLFAGAGLTGFARMNDDKHWLSDVVAGAAIGIVASRLVDKLAGSRRLAPASSGLGLKVTF